ncbi:UNVERIFIED_CONTAM: hypothetical protein PYX00_006217 [Menopon gallinae]|uniref:Solute carrier family 66 member 2 n=1 Tax=Menopon gallinae TaxID=328185 RepID=A0AAW2HVP5_9NEOP
MEYIISEIQDISMSKLAKWTASLVMIFGGVAPYIPQYREIKRTENAEGFSLHVCLALLLANTLRILFWFGKRYETPLLLQSLIMNATMLIMVRLCVHIKNKNQPMKRKERVFTGQHSFLISDWDTRYFWAWTDFQSYVDFLLFFSIISSLITYLMFDSPVFIELIGFMAVFIEATLGMPQLFQNYWNKSTRGMSVSMVLMWTCGDIFKTGYFILREAPSQFWMCGVLQVSVDIIILLQVHVYRDNAFIRKD